MRFRITALTVSGILASVLLSGCSGVQSALDPAGPGSGKIAGLWWFIFGIGVFVFVVTMSLMLWGVTRRAPNGPEPPPGGSERFVLYGGIIIPAIFLVTMLIVSLKTTVALKPPESTLTIQVIGHQWWWEVRYPQQNINTANEIEIPAGQPVRLELKSQDVAHSFWVPSLNGKMDLIPGHPNIFWIAADHPGVYRGQCAEYCGTQHAHMSFLVVAMPQGEFDAWVAARQQPHPKPAGKLVRGQQAFLLAGCKDCHTIEGTGAGGKIGPDLTHLASRRTIGAGLLPRTPGTLEGWISDPQAAKPGNKMPRMYLPPDDLHALRAYLDTLD